MRYHSPEAVKPLLTPDLSGGAEIAFLDIREPGQYGAGHPFFAVNLPYSRLEALAPRLLPRRGVQTVLLDDGDGVAELAAARMAGLGYSDLAILQGGAPAWAAAGFTLFDGVNLPSKTFGELVEHAMHTPSISAEELHALQESETDLVLLDGRTPAEYARMTIPGARSCPNGELGYRLPALGLGPETRIVVNCAGRTRSIIGAQTLRNLGYPAVALRNGTQGWELAGLQLARGNTPTALPRPDPAAARADARRLIAGAGLELVGAAELTRWQADAERTLYLLDVRTREEFAAGRLAGAVHAPGGQLVQATDQWVAVRGARILLCDDTGMRAATTALWLRSMGHDAAILDVDVSAAGTAPSPAASRSEGEPPELPAISPTDLPARLAAGAVLLDLSPSMDYRAGHIAGARWAIRPRLAEIDLAGGTEILLTARDAAVAAAVARDLGERHPLPVSLVPGGPAEWRAAGFDLVATPDDPPDAACIDYVFHTHDRHSGNLAAAQAYLDWETGLVDRLDAQERATLQPELSLPRA